LLHGGRVPAWLASRMARDDLDGRVVGDARPRRRQLTLPF